MTQRGVKTLEAIIADTRLESGRSADRNYGQDEYDAIKRLLQREQERLYWDYNWPFLRVQRSIVLAAGQRYYDAPEDLNFARIVSIEVFWGNNWQPLERGITPEDYNYFNSDADVRSDPAEKWDMILTGAEGDTEAAGEQLEIFPIPATAGELRLVGFANLQPFIADNDVCTLDPTLLSLFASAELLARDQRADAQAKLTAANRLYAKMRGASDRRTPSNKFSMAGGGDCNSRRYYNGSKIIVVSGGS